MIGGHVLYKNKQRQQMIVSLLIVLYMTVGLIALYNFPHYTEIILRKNYIIDLIAYFIMGSLFLVIFIKDNMNILHPITLVSFLYIIMFTITPMIDICSNEILWFGVNLFEYGPKGTIIAVIGYIAFCFGYSITINKKSIYVKLRCYDHKKIKSISLSGWIVCFIISLIYLAKSGGFSLSYILSLGIDGNINMESISSTPLGILSMFSYSLLPLSLTYFNYGKSRILKLILFVCTLMIQLIRGFRFIVIILILSYIFFIYIKNGKRPKLKSMIIYLILFCFIIGFMGFYRDNVRVGNEMALEKFSIDDINYALFDNFRIYKTYYSIIKAVPTLTDYMYGQQMVIYTLIMFIPRAIWPSKPYPPGKTAVELGISNYANMAGTAYPNIGEFYYEFGLLGVIFFMFLFGIWLKRIKDIYLHTNNVFDNMIYSLIVPTTFQLIIRGYTPSNFYLVIFIIAPIIIIEKISRNIE